jgi:phosphatidylserine decarboxylase
MRARRSGRAQRNPKQGGRMALASYGKREMIVGCLTLAALGAISLLMFPYAAPVFGLLLLSLLWFFRDPQRRIPDAPRILVAPADGKVVEIADVPLGAPPYIPEPATRIAIFLSIISCHINRAPAEGVVEYLNYQPGAFLLAWKPEAAERNEQNAFGLALAGEPNGRILVRQIAGAIARRIVCVPRQGQTVKRGERIGMIKFGSRTELIVPVSLRFRPRVKVGDKVFAGETVMGDFA